MEITANSVQLVNANQNILFTDTPVKPTKCIRHREGSGLISLRGNQNCQCNAKYFVTFSGNIAVPTGGTIGSISLALTYEGEPIASSTMIVTPAAVGEYFNVSGSAYIEVPCSCCVTISVENTSTIPINVQNANLIVARSRTV